MQPMKRRLIAPDEPDPVVVRRASGRSPFFSHLRPRRAPRTEGPGRYGYARRRIRTPHRVGHRRRCRFAPDSEALDAPLVEQVYSRLVIDCNRDPSVESAMPEISELTTIPANVCLSQAARTARIEEIFEPYHAVIARLLEKRAQDGRETILVAMHSFTPVFKGFVRPWHVGVLYNRNPDPARILFDLFEKEGDLVVGDNQPYQISDDTDYGIPVHGERRRIPHVELEIRQDLIADERGQAAWAERLCRLLPKARNALNGKG